MSEQSDDHSDEQDEDYGELSFAENLLGYNLRRAYAAQLQRFNAYFRELDIRPVQFTLLGYLYHNPGVSQARVGKALDIQRANLVTLLDELEQRQLLRRAPSHDDKRSRVLNLTEQGKDFTERLLDINVRAEGDLDRIIGEENRAHLITLLRAIRKLRDDPP
jgi:DNA-binding MarR family transcriptional regulator